jgi:hypothetical protein
MAGTKDPRRGPQPVDANRRAMRAAAAGTHPGNVSPRRRTPKHM